MIQLEPWQWALAVLAALIVGVSKTGIAGVGMVAVVIFANVIPAKQSTGFVLPLLMVGDIVAVASYRRHTEWRHVLRMFPWAAGGVVLGYFAMGRIDDRQAKTIIGAIVLIMVALHLLRRRRAAKLEHAVEEQGAWFAPTVGVLAGFTTLVANAAGPLMAIYLLAMRLPKMIYVGTGAVFFLLLNAFKVPFMIGLDLITPQSFGFNLLFAPAVLVGAWLGKKLLTRIDQKLFENLALGLSALAGLKLLF